LNGVPLLRYEGQGGQNQKPEWQSARPGAINARCHVKVIRKKSNAKGYLAINSNLLSAPSVNPSCCRFRASELKRSCLHGQNAEQSRDYSWSTRMIWSKLPIKARGLGLITVFSRRCFEFGGFTFGCG
jgi:hypothetical protein